VTEVYRKILSLFDAREQRQFWLLTALMVLVALVEVVGISSVLMLLNVLASPSTIGESRVLSAFRDTLGYDNPFSFQCKCHFRRKQRPWMREGHQHPGNLSRSNLIVLC
jgi:hypothetical protein